MLLVLSGCTSGAATARAPGAAPPPPLEPAAIAVAAPAFPLAEQAGWPEDPHAAADVARALDPDPEISRAGVAALQRRGQGGLDALLAALGEHAAAEPRAREVVAQTARQLDAHASGLFWHTDRAEALARAKAEHKPVLSLRLLGRLDEDLSCANSRFFRTAVYPNAAVSAYLRKNFVLHWSSERPAPRITIDYGDGRKLERTITGNSLHYVLDVDGHVVDALPGLYGAKAFLELLERARSQTQPGTSRDEGARVAISRAFHLEAANLLRARWRDDLALFGLTPPVPVNAGLAPSAAVAAPIALTKMAVEGPVVASLLPTDADLALRTDDATWRQLAIRALDRARLDGVSRALIRAKRPMAPSADGARLVEGPELERLYLALELRMAEDTVKNELLLHLRVHDWLASAPLAFEALNARVYAELFLTPITDPWLGLMPADAFSGLEHDGVVVPQEQPPAENERHRLLVER